MDKHELYNKLPYPMKILATSTWGYYLRSWRYGPETESLVEEAIDRETWSQGQWTTWREERLAFMLHHAATTVPYYRAYWQNCRRAGDQASWELLENWPVLQKAKVRDNPRQFISDLSKDKRLYIDHTGGTTGTPTLIFLSRSVTRRWFALHEARVRHWIGVNYQDRWGIFGGQQIIPLAQKTPPYWVWNQGLKQIYFSIFHINSISANAYLEALWKYKPLYLIVYPSALFVLAKFMLHQGLQPPPLKAIISNSEVLTETYRKTIQQAFNCPVRDTYGMAEMLSASSECAEGNMHFWPETGIMEIFNPADGTVSQTQPSGMYCLTGLFNEDMPLIRYVNGDIGELPDWSQPCACGRTLPVMGKVHGRSNDLVLTKDGRELYILDSLYNGLPVVEAQLVQFDLDNFEVNLVPGDGYKKQDVEKQINYRLSQYLGTVDVHINEVEQIPRNTNGKFCSFISKINPKAG